MVMKVGTLATVTGSILCTMQETVAALKLGHRSPVKPRYKRSGTDSEQEQWYRLCANNL